MVTTAADRELRDLLASAPLETVGQFVTASNATLLVSVGDSGLHGVYKPIVGEAPLVDFPGGTLHLREVAAFEVDRAIGWGMVPLTVLRETGPFGPGSLQLFIDHDPQRHYFWLLKRGRARVVEQLRRMVGFDLLTNNADRKGGHVLLGDDDHIWLVDHGICFHDEPKLRTVAWHFAGDPVPDEVRESAVDLGTRLRRRDDPLTTRLRTLLSRTEIEALAARAGIVGRLEAFPSIPGPRSVPWPPL